MKTTTTSKGQIVIPAAIRRRFGITDGTRIQIEVNEDTREIILTPTTREYVNCLRGKLKGTGLLNALLAEKTKEKER